MIANEAPRIAGEIAKVESVLGGNFATLLKGQHSIKHINGDLIWNPNMGWGVVKDANYSDTYMSAYLRWRGANVEVATRGYYINVRIASEAYPSISRIMNFL